MLKKKIVILLTGCIFLSFACKTQWQIESIQGERIKVDQHYSQPVDSGVMAIIGHYKTLLDKEMDQVIGRSAVNMSTGIPESTLTNLTADVLLHWADSRLEGDYDFSIINSQGIRAPLSEGNITQGNMFELFPFENKISFLELKGQYVEDLFKFYARKGGEGISASVRLQIRNKEIASLTIRGKALDKSKIYRIATIDYLAEGNDGMKALQFAEKATHTQILLRDIMVDYVKQQTIRGKAIQARKDGRITLL